MKKQDRKEFIAYLRKCTLAQVHGVYKKEMRAYRWEYMRLAEDELNRRSVEIGK